MLPGVPGIVDGSLMAMHYRPLVCAAEIFPAFAWGGEERQLMLLLPMLREQNINIIDHVLADKCRCRLHL